MSLFSRLAKPTVVTVSAVTALVGLSATPANALTVPGLGQIPGLNAPGLTAPALPSIEGSAQLPASVTEVLKRIQTQAEGASQETAAALRTNAQRTIDALPIDQNAKNEAHRILDQIIPPATGSNSQPEAITAPDSQQTPSAPSAESQPQPREEARQAPANPCSPTARACVDLANQKTWLQENGRITYGPVPMTSGMEGYETTRGNLHVTRKVKDEWSIPYNGPMPYSVYFTNTGEAFHEGSLQQMSHGCIHLSNEAAQKYYYTLEVGDEVHIW